jgi:exopolysaccharide biosynthesis polyprenyl glycosylphosphotransferase
MLTSEYLKDGEEEKVAGFPPLQRPRGRSIAGVSLAAPALRMLSDALVILVATGVAIFLRTAVLGKLAALWGVDRSLSSDPIGLIYLLWFVFAYLLVARRYGLYSPMPLNNGAHETRLITQAVLNAGLLLCGAFYMTRDFASSRALVFLLVLSSAVMLNIRRAMWRVARYHDYARGVELRNIVIIGTNRLSAALGAQITRHYRLGYNLRGYVAVPASREEHAAPCERILGGLDNLKQLVRANFVDEVVIAQPCSTEATLRLLQEARDLDVDIRAISGYYPEFTANAPTESLGSYPVVALHRRERRLLPVLVKRAIDILLSSLVLAVLFPIMAVIALAILCEGRGPVFYISQRIGKRGRVFPCFKFRTMVANAEELKQQVAALNERDGILFKVANDPRVTRVGKLLRKHSLDELPQFFNVLRGEMSIIGPRPPIASEVEHYELEHLRRLEVLPGLTGLWQVQARQDSSFARYIALDTAYIENWSLWLDFKILIRTAGVVFRGTGS